MDKEINKELKVNFWPSFIDLTITILIIFILISVFKFVLNTKSLSTLEIKARQERFEDIFRKNFKNEIDKTILINTEGNIQELTFSDKLLFDSDEVHIKEKGKDILDKLTEVINEAKILKMTKDKKNKNYYLAEIQIKGHADSDPSNNYGSNWVLSALRAIKVATFFCDEKKLEPQYFSAAGYSEHRNEKPNDTKENKALNRRIELRIVYSPLLEFKEGY